MKKIASILLSTWLLLGNMGITWATHYCGELAVKHEVMLGHEALDCGMPQRPTPCENGHAISQKSCCNNDYQTFDVGDEYQTASLQDIPMPNSDATVAPSFFCSFDAYFSDDQPFRIGFSSSPPLPIRHSQAFLQTFLI